MSSSSSLLKLLCSAACVLPVLLGCGRVMAQANPAIELKEVQAAYQAAAKRIAEMEARLDKAKGNVNDLAEALASANGDAQQARELYERLRIQMEGLGIAALDKTDAGLQQRLLTALSDLRIMHGQNRALATALMDLSQATLDYAKAAGPVQGEPKKELDAKLAQAEQALAQLQNDAVPANESELLNARVVSLKEEAGVAVFNVGSRHGVRPGMPFSIYREDKPVANALVVDVRQDISGAVIGELVNKDEPVKVGDTCKVEPVKN
jgi:exonuclease VII small subunit